MALAAVLVQHNEHLERLAALSAVEDEVIGPDLTTPARFGRQCRWGLLAVSPPLGWSAPRQAEPLLLPDAPDVLVIDLLSCPVQQGGDPPIAEAAVLSGE